MTSIWRVPFPSTLDKHLDLTDTTRKLRQIIPRERRRRNLKLLSTSLRVVHALSQNS